MKQNEELKDSCRDICGKWQALPCSCDPKCLVFGNCCEDFDVECSGIAKESQSKYAGLLHSEVKCINSIFVITSCSVADTKNQNFTSLDRMKELDVQTKQGELFADFLLNETPVLDVSTGLSFINKTVFSCNGGNLSNALNWNIIVNEIDKIFDFQRKEILLENLKNNENNFVYVLPYRYDENYKSQTCRNISAASCSKIEHPLYSKCKSFISSVVTHVDKHPIIFNNKYCAQCNGFTNVSVFNDTNEHNCQECYFQALMSVSGARVKLEMRSFQLDKQWISIECNKTGNQEYKHSLQCDVICPTGLVARPNRLCKMPLSLQIAVSTNLILLGKTDVKIWADYVYIFFTLKVTLDIETVLNYSKVDRLDDNKESFYWIEMLAYESTLKHQVNMLRFLFHQLANSLVKVNATKNSKNVKFSVNSSQESFKMCGLVMDIKEKELSPQKTDNCFICSDSVLTTRYETVKTQNSCHIQFSRCSSVHFLLFYFPIQLSCLLIVSFFI
ncbi:hypothetical protein BgiBS90_026042 [Biomphalaria glabrata]|nr:hypothetical protein BgiBS90_026042 [Biomphalaria glabrata]